MNTRKISTFRVSFDATPSARSNVVAPESALDEVAVGQWLHLEAMGGGHWFLCVGNKRIGVTVRGGHATRVRVEDA